MFVLLFSYISDRPCHFISLTKKMYKKGNCPFLVYLKTKDDVQVTR